MARKSTHWWPRKVPTRRSWLGLGHDGSSSQPGLTHPHRLPICDHDHGMVQEAVEHGGRRGMVRQEVSPLVERPVAGDGQTPALVGGGNEPKEKLGAGVVERGKAEFVDYDEVGPQQLVDYLPHGVVGQAAVEGLDEVSGDEVASPQSSCDRGKAESQKEMGLPRSGRPDQAEVLPGAHPLQAGQIVEGGPGAVSYTHLTLPTIYSV